MKLCNGIGQCDFSSGSCICPYGWGFDADIGICGKLIVNTSRWSGLARCPGIISWYEETSYLPKKGVSRDKSSRQNYRTRIYISLNPTDHRVGLSKLNSTVSTIYYYIWEPSDTYIGIDESQYTHFLNLSSNSSAGPMVHDQAKDRIFYVDLNPFFIHIGVAYYPSSSHGSSINNSVWLHLTKPIFGFAMDAHFQRRKLFWSTPGVYNNADGGLSWAFMDSNPPVAYSLTAAIGQVALIYFALNIYLPIFLVFCN
jgi:hypothetical protein